MNKKFITCLVLAFTLLVLPISAVLAAPALRDEFITGTVTGLVCETDTTTGITTFLVTVEDTDGATQTVRIEQLIAEGLGLITIDENGSPDCSEEALAEALGAEVEIAQTAVILEEPQHPVGGALATFFSDIIDYDTIMAAHDGEFDFGATGFGVIAQALWMTQKLEGDAEIFLAILEAKESKDFTAFEIENEDGTTTMPKNWGQFRKVIMDGDKGNLGIVMSGHDNRNGQGNGNGQGNSNGQGSGNGQGNGNGNGNGNSIKNKDKDNKGNGNGNKDK